MPFEHDTVRFVGDLDLLARPSMERTLAEVDADVVAIDLTEVTFIDASALGCLVGFKKRLRARGRLGIVKIVTSNRRFQQLFQITGLNKVFDIVESSAKAGDATHEIGTP
jgi:anti-anti-sigma factor